jgi:hypothetical protein
MDSITLNFSFPLNVSVQKGDTAYYTNDINGTTIVLIGVITAIVNNTIVCDIAGDTIRPTTSSFILFSKDAGVNTSGLKGYYAEVQFKNNSEDAIELFSVGSEVFESSK